MWGGCEDDKRGYSHRQEEEQQQQSVNDQSNLK